MAPPPPNEGSLEALHLAFFNSLLSYSGHLGTFYRAPKNAALVILDTRGRDLNRSTLSLLTPVGAQKCALWLPSDEAFV